MERRTRYELTVHYEVTPEDDIDVVEEGTLRRQRYDTAVEALGDLGIFIAHNGGPDMWDQSDEYEVGSCWLPDERDGLDVCYRATLDRVTETTDRERWRFTTTKERVPLTWGRLNGANEGALGKPHDWTARHGPEAGGRA